MRAPRPEHLAAELSAMADVLVRRVIDNYNWLYDQGYERVTRDNERVSTSGVNDEVGGIITSGYHRRLRLAVSDAARFAAQALAAMKGADAALARAFNTMEGPTAEHTPAGFHDAAPRMIAPSEHKALVAAVERRQREGGGYGRS